MDMVNGEMVTNTLYETFLMSWVIIELIIIIMTGIVDDCIFWNCVKTSCWRQSIEFSFFGINCLRHGINDGKHHSRGGGVGDPHGEKHGGDHEAEHQSGLKAY